MQLCKFEYNANGCHRQSGTVEFLQMVDKLFDSVNSLTFNDSEIQRKPFTRKSLHLKIMTDAIDLFSSIQVINVNTGENKTAKLKCSKGWIITLKSIIAVWKHLNNQGTSFLVTWQLNQDPLENFLEPLDNRVATLTP